MRNLLLLLCLLLSTATSAQKDIHGKIVDSEKKGVAFAIVQVVGSGTGVYTDEQGNFKINITAGAQKLAFYCMGYERREIPLNELSTGELVVVLKEKINELAEVSVEAKASQRSGKSKILGKSKLKQGGEMYMNVGTEYGIFLDSKGAKNGILEEVVVYVTSTGIPDSRFRIHVYDANERSKLPINDISGGNIIAHAEKGNEWVKVNVRDKNIKIPDAIIVSIEWISDHGNNLAIQNKGVMKYQGQVIGLTTDYGAQSKYVKFIFQDNLQAANKEWLVPMIYCTYHK